MFPYTPSDLGGVFFARKRLKKSTVPQKETMPFPFSRMETAHSIPSTGYSSASTAAFSTASSTGAASVTTAVPAL